MPYRLKGGFRPLGGGYTGRMMIQQSLLPQARRIRMSASLSPEARRRLRWMEFYEAHGRNARLTCRHFDISSATFYRWWRRYTPRRLQSVEDDRRTRRPRRVRAPHTPPEVVAAIRRLREQYPRWGKAKLAVLLRREGWTVSVSTVGRTLTRLRAAGQVSEPPVVRAQLAKRRRRRTRPHARRKPWEYIPHAPGDLVQIDTTPIEVRPGLRRVHFTAADVVSRTVVVMAQDRATSTAAERVLAVVLERLGFPVRALQIDGGSEFKAIFETTRRPPHPALRAAAAESEAQRACRAGAPYPSGGVLRSHRDPGLPARPQRPPPPMGRDLQSHPSPRGPGLPHPE